MAIEVFHLPLAAISLHLARRGSRGHSDPSMKGLPSGRPLVRNVLETQAGDTSGDPRSWEVTLPVVRCVQPGWRR
jgi:hypothetical protein